MPQNGTPAVITRYYSLCSAVARDVAFNAVFYVLNAFSKAQHERNALREGYSIVDIRR